MVIKNIQALRALAANGVILSHLLIVEQKYGGGFTFLPHQIHFGSCGVDLFFVISGFIMATVARDVSWSRFLIDRATRIYPPYWFYTTAVLAVFLVSPGIVNSSFDHPPSLWRSYLLVPDTVEPLLAVGWTLIHEMYFYVCFAGIIALGLALPRGLLAWAVLIVLFNIVVHPERQSAPIMTVLVHPLTLEFIAGAFVGLLIQKGFRYFAPFAAWGGTVIMGAMALLAGNALVDNADWLHVLCLGAPCVLVVYGAAAWEVDKMPVTPKWMVAVGDASYSIYLSHVLIISVIGHLFARLPMKGSFVEVIFVILCVGSANIFGMISHHFIELPSLKYTRRIFGKKRANPATH